MNAHLTVAKPPRLQNGDRLTRVEFERRYDAMPDLKKAELIGGVVYMGSPVNHAEHGRPHTHILLWLGQFAVPTPGMDMGDNSTLRLDDYNEPQPDAFLMLRADYGGQARIDSEGYLCGAPELVVEVAASSVNYDLYDKRQTYREHGVKEYVVWRVLENALDWFVLRGNTYELLATNAAGVYQSTIFPGLWLDTGALLAGDLPGVFQVVKQGLASPEHQAFVAELRRRGATSS